MSKKGMLKRGEQYHKTRDINGSYPAGVTNDPNKMKDLNYFLESQSDKPTPEPTKETKSKGKK